MNRWNELHNQCQSFDEFLHEKYGNEVSPLQLGEQIFQEHEEYLQTPDGATRSAIRHAWCATQEEEE